MGLTLIHEHILVDFIGADSTGYHRWDKDLVVQRVLPFLEEIKSKGVKTIIECTPSYLGKDPVLLHKLTDLTGIRFITNTGYYGAVGEKYLPKHAFTESAEELAKRWIREYEEGIEDTGIIRVLSRSQSMKGLSYLKWTGSWCKPLPSPIWKRAC